jgi:hypothetical protein
MYFLLYCNLSAVFLIKKFPSFLKKKEKWWVEKDRVSGFLEG